MIYVILYLLVIILANLTVFWFGTSVVVINAFLFIGFDFAARDKLHDAWQGKNLWVKMFGLILSGGLLTWIINKDAHMIAVASLIAFSVSSLIDATIYQVLRNKKWFIRINSSNVFGALSDSIIFPTIAFGGFLPSIVFGQFVAKVFGGFLWSIAIQVLKTTQTTDNRF